MHKKIVLEFELFLQTATYQSGFPAIRELNPEVAVCVTAVVSLNESLPGHQHLQHPHGEVRTTQLWVLGGWWGCTMVRFPAGAQDSCLQAPWMYHHPRTSSPVPFVRVTAGLQLLPCPGPVAPTFLFDPGNTNPESRYVGKRSWQAGLTWNSGVSDPSGRHRWTSTDDSQEVDNRKGDKEEDLHLCRQEEWWSKWWCGS